MSYTLPLELILLIASTLDGDMDKESLKSFALASSTFRIPCQRILFFHIRITYSASMPGRRKTLGERLFDLLSVSHPISTYVKQVTISDSEKNMAYTEPISTTDALRIHHGRPNVKGLLHDEITSSTGPVSVDVAGPGALTASVRSSLTAGVAAPGWAYKRGHTVTLHVETFGMVQT
ncbi:hypothetical protein NMY22_g13701 [Coprinellus aureogranulatus]|nr:hypothetical protein NMY22_g13701 [Coprinellus aureogranulatus]